MNKKILGLLSSILATHAFHAAAPDDRPAFHKAHADTPKPRLDGLLALCYGDDYYATPSSQRIDPHYVEKMIRTHTKTAKQTHHAKRKQKLSPSKARIVATKHALSKKINLPTTPVSDKTPQLSTSSCNETSMHEMGENTQTPVGRKYSIKELLALNPGINIFQEEAIDLLDEMANQNIECAHSLASNPELLQAVNLNRRLINLSLRPNDKDVPTSPMPLESNAPELEAFTLEPHELEALEPEIFDFAL